MPDAVGLTSSISGRTRPAVPRLANAAGDRVRARRPKAKVNTQSFQQRCNSARGDSERRRALIFANAPNVLDLTT